MYRHPTPHTFDLKMKEDLFLCVNVILKAFKFGLLSGMEKKEA
jgi:hypothetical protein